jgi:hypothetical protein
VRIGISEVEITIQEDTQLVKPKARLGTVEVTADGEGLVSHAGTALLAELADRAGLTAALSEACRGRGSVARRTIRAGCLSRWR